MSDGAEEALYEVDIPTARMYQMFSKSGLALLVPVSKGEDDQINYKPVPFSEFFNGLNDVISGDGKAALTCQRMSEALVECQAVIVAARKEIFEGLPQELQADAKNAVAQAVASGEVEDDSDGDDGNLVAPVKPKGKTSKRTKRKKKPAKKKRGKKR